MSNNFKITLPFTEEGRATISLLEEAGVVADWDVGRHHYEVELNREPTPVERGLLPGMRGPRRYIVSRLETPRGVFELTWTASLDGFYFPWGVKKL